MVPTLCSPSILPRPALVCSDKLISPLPLVPSALGPNPVLTVDYKVLPLPISSTPSLSAASRSLVQKRKQALPGPQKQVLASPGPLPASSLHLASLPPSPQPHLTPIPALGLPSLLPTPNRELYFMFSWPLVVLPHGLSQL